MGIQIVDTVLNYIQANLSSKYPDLKYYPYDPRGRKYKRPFLAVQFRGKAPSFDYSSIGSTAFESVLDIVVGVAEKDPALAEEAMENICSDLMNIFIPWKYIDSYNLVISTDYLHEQESSSRLKDEGQIRLKIVTFA